MLKGFKAFIFKGNIIDLAVAVVMGTAFVAIVTAFSDNVINPILAAIGGSNDLGFGFKITDSDETFVNIGAVITAGINFLMIAVVLYFLVVVPAMAAQRRMFGEKTDDAKNEVVL
ncbi:large conductance mechanosensitive channel protein MscL, partial [Skermania pinensis]